MFDFSKIGNFQFDILIAVICATKCGKPRVLYSTFCHLRPGILYVAATFFQRLGASIEGVTLETIRSRPIIPPRKFFASLEKYVGQFKKFGPLSENSSSTWCPKLVKGLI